MSTIRTIIVKCKIPRSEDFKNRVHDFASEHHADFADVTALRCKRCLQFIDDVVTSDVSRVACSNCYGDDLNIIRLRLAFQDWGEQNGGAKARDARLEFARAKAAESTPKKEPANAE